MESLTNAHKANELEPCSVFTYRPYQDRVIEQTRGNLRQLPRGDRRVLIQAATGSGKTAIAAKIARGVVANNKRVLFICDTLELVEQAVKTFDAVGLPVGVMQAQHQRTDMERLMQVCSQATVNSWIKGGRFDAYNVGLIFYDECHVQYKVRDKLADMFPDVPVIGLTATPFSAGLGLYYKSVVSAISMSELIDQGFLCPFDVYGPNEPDLVGVRSSGGDWNMDDVADRYDAPLVADIVQTYLKHRGDGRRTLLFACRVTHSKRMAKELQEAGIRAEHVDSYPDDPDERWDRAMKIQRYHEGEIEVLCSVGICTKGFDSPETDCLIFARPTKSMSLHWQMFGRGLRTCEGKERCLILDHAGNTLRHGFPTDVTDFSLSHDEKRNAKTDRREKGEPLPTRCTSCGFMKPAGVHQCPACQFAPEKKDQTINVDGKLVKLKSYKVAERKRRNREAAATARTKVWTQEERQQFYSGLVYIERDRGYKPGWSKYRYKAKFGSEPKGLWREPLPPTDDVTRWVKYCNIKHSFKGNNAWQRKKTKHVKMQ